MLRFFDAYNKTDPPLCGSAKAVWILTRSAGDLLLQVIVFTSTKLIDITEELLIVTIQFEVTITRTMSS